METVTFLSFKYNNCHHQGTRNHRGVINYSKQCHCPPMCHDCTVPRTCQTLSVVVPLLLKASTPALFVWASPPCSSFVALCRWFCLCRNEVMLVLSEWGRWAIVLCGVAVVAVTMVVVVCVVTPSCWLYNQFLSEEERRLRDKEREMIYSCEAPTLRFISYTKTMPTPTTPTETILCPSRPPDLTLTHTVGDAPNNARYQFISPLTQGPPENSSLLGALSSKRDSTYSSMSEYSGRTSPTNSCRSSVEESSPGTPTGGAQAQGQINFAIQYLVTSEDRSAGKLIITVLEAKGLCGREYLGGGCDPYVKVVVWRERRSLRRLKAPPLHVFRTRTVRHTQEPNFNQSFVVETNKSELKELVVKLVAMDSDKWMSPTTLGEVVQPLKDIKNLATIDQRSTFNYFLVPPKLDLGEVLFGLSYLPTAQRLSVSIIKANNLKFSNVVNEINDFCPYIRVMLINASGRVLKKKKTTWRTATTTPNWNETLIFDLTQAQIENVTFLLAVCTRPQTPPSPSTSNQQEEANGEALSDLSSNGNTPSPHPNYESNRKEDKYLGKVVLGTCVRGDIQRQHWTAVLSAPRKMVSQWHPLK